jgi:competence protein ComEC
MFKKEQIIIFSLLFISLLPLAIAFTIPSQKLHFIACNVGQGDAILITKGFTQILIDGGPDESVLACLSNNIPFWDKNIELIINTHPDKDHIGGLDNVIQSYNVTHFVLSGQSTDSQAFKDLEKAIKDNNIETYIPLINEQIKVGELDFTVLWTPENQSSVLGATNQKTNESSIVLHFQYQDFDALLTGDITEREEKQIIKQNEFNSIEVLKVAHHGSKYSSSREFLEAVKPSIAVISVGKNPWGHPTKEVLDRLDSVNSQILRTDQDKINLKI